jgi:hypothetical protein
VTEVLQNIGWKQYGLMHWAHGLGLKGIGLKEERERLADAGTVAHAMVDAEVKGKPTPSLDGLAPGIVERAQQSFDAFRAWRKTSRFELVASEIILVSEKLGYAGQIDCVAHLEGAVAVLDWKSSKALYPDQAVQLAAYAQLWDEAHPDLIVKALRVVRFPPEGGFADHQIGETSWKAALRAWDAAMELHRVKKLIKAA